MKNLLCLIFHDWEIYKVSFYKYNLSGKGKPKLAKEGFRRRCLRCEKEQSLERPKRYHTSKYIWVDIVKN